MDRIGFGGGCHWCTEAVFKAIKGVCKVEQGWISSIAENSAPSEGVIVYFDGTKVSLKELISIHLDTHSSESNHKLRNKYRSAIYTFNQEQALEAKKALNDLSSTLGRDFVTQVLPFQKFKLNESRYLNYYERKSASQFSLTHIKPKIKLLTEKYTKLIER